MNDIAEITIEGFIKQYAENSNITIRELCDFGLYAVPCHCESRRCRGWQMMHDGTPWGVTEAEKETGKRIMRELANE